MRNHIVNIMLFVAVLFVACKKADPPVLDDGASTLITDLPGDTEGSMGGTTDGKKKGFDTFLFRFRDQQQIWLRNAQDSARWLQTAEWDLAFTGAYNSVVYVNNARNQYNPAFGGPQTPGAVLMVDQPYDSVTEAPSDLQFDQSDVLLISWAQKARDYGWFYYNRDNHIMVPIKNRTWLIRLADGKYAKLELINVYKGNPPVVTDLFWPAPYLTFRYYVQQDGSKNLRTK